ncbi:MAG: PD40 domain-containing protein [Cytophagaceae bacterium]|nr:PD40 domain-containing protein [Gemmatimonadaceae bacterium]
MTASSLRFFLTVVAAGTLIAWAPAPSSAQAPDSARRDPTNTLPLVTTRQARFTTDEGTWMSVDVSPDGRTVVFDLLGDVYSVPISGGKATLVVGGNSVDMQPRYSPDGRSLVFISDRNGSRATWISDANGARPRLLTAGGLFPAFTPDGREIVTGSRLVDVRGGAGVALQGFGSGPSFTADGRYIWFQTGTQAARYDRRTGSVGYRTALPGGALRPMVSKDGRTLLYFTRFEARAALVARDLATGGDRWILMGTQPEAGSPPPPPFVPGPPPGPGAQPQIPPAGVGPLPRSAWLPDESGIVTSYGGKLWRVDLASGSATPIPFSADVVQSIGPLVRGTHEVGDSVTAREIRDPAISPDGRRVAFTALGKVWVMDVPGGTPRRLTSTSGVVETAPTWSPDGQSVAYATWVDGEGGDIFLAASGGGAPRNLTRAPAMYARLNYTPDGSRLVFARAPRRTRTYMVDDSGIQLRTPQGAGSELNLELRWMAPTGGAQQPITVVADVGAMPLGGFPHFTADANRVFFHDGTALVSVQWDGSDRKVVLAGAAPQTQLAWDGVHVLSRAGRRQQIYLFDRPQVADSLTIDPSIERPLVPVRRLTRAGGDSPVWSRDGRRAVWVQSNSLFVYDVQQGDRATTDSLAAATGRPATPDSARRPAAAADSGTRWNPAYAATRTDVRITVAADKPSGAVVLRGARIVTMKGQEIIENGDVVITGNRITAVGARGSVSIPRGARSIDVAGKTIVPGYIDTHAQIAAPGQVHRTLVSQYLANLAFGVTSTREAEVSGTDVFTYSDRVATGDLLGPRIFATGPAVLDTLLTLRTNAEARDFLGAYASGYRSGTVRGDLTATRADRQRFLTVARELGLTAAAVGSPDFAESLGAILDGYANHQTAYEIFPLHGDIAQLIAASGITYTPVLQGRVGNRIGFEHILATEQPHADPKVRRFYYHKELDRIARPRANWVVAEEYPFQDIGASAARIVAAGGKVALGSGGRVQGLALHWDMWLMAKGGMPHHDILRAATLFGAEALGVGSQLGSIEAGKLADLQVLDRNPLTDIRNTHSVRYVMKNGRLYDAATLDEVGANGKKLGNLWWTNLDVAENR